MFFQDQYIFIHDAILESVTCGDTEIEAGDLRKRLAQLKTRDESGRSGLDLQFAVRLLNSTCKQFNCTQKLSKWFGRKITFNPLGAIGVSLNKQKLMNNILAPSIIAI